MTASLLALGARGAPPPASCAEAAAAGGLLRRLCERGCTAAERARQMVWGRKVHSRMESCAPVAAHP